MNMILEGTEIITSAVGALNFLTTESIAKIVVEMVRFWKSFIWKKLENDVLKYHLLSLGWSFLLKKNEF